MTATLHFDYFIWLSVRKHKQYFIFLLVNFSVFYPYSDFLLVGSVRMSADVVGLKDSKSACDVIKMRDIRGEVGIK